MVSKSMYSRISGPMPLRTISGTAAVTASSDVNGASTVAWWGLRGYSLRNALVTRASVPSEPTTSWVRS